MNIENFVITKDLRYSRVGAHGSRRFTLRLHAYFDDIPAGWAIFNGQEGHGFIECTEKFIEPQFRRLGIEINLKKKAEVETHAVLSNDDFILNGA